MPLRVPSALSLVGALVLAVLGVAGFGLGLVWMNDVVARGAAATWRDYAPSYAAFLVASALLLGGLLLLMRRLLRDVDEG